MTCDRCGRKINHIYITEDHEKICDRTCKGRRRLNTMVDFRSEDLAKAVIHSPRSEI